MPAEALLRRRVIVAPDAFVEIAIWRVPKPVEGSDHPFKYRLAYVVGGQCVLRYDNERGKGGHRHAGGSEALYRFTTPGQLMKDFEADLVRWNREHGRS